MFIEKLSLSNFRGVHEMELNLHPNLNLFVGVNGAGKTTVLDASAILLSWLANRIKTHRAPGKQITEGDIKNNERFAVLRIFVDADDTPFV